MNKLNKDQKQKIFLSTLMMLMLVYCYFVLLLPPLAKDEKHDTAAIAALDTKLAQARTRIKRSKSVQEQAVSAQEMLAQINERIPDGAPIAWFPPQMRAFLDRHNIKETVTKGGTLEPITDPVLADYKNASWTVDMPEVQFSQLGIALAGLENENILLEIKNLQINTQPSNLEKQRVTMNVVTLLK